MSHLRKWAATIGYEGLERWSLEVPRAVSRVNARKLPDSDLSPAEVELFKEFYVMWRKMNRCLTVSFRVKSRLL